MAHIGVDFTNIPQYAGNEPLPTAWYNAFISASEIKPTKDAAVTNHHMLHLEFTIQGGQYNGRKVFTQLNIGHSNPATKEIAYKQLSSIAHSVGVIQVQDSQQLHNIPLKIRVKLKEGGEKKDNMGNVVGKYDPQNEVAGYKNINEATPGEPAGPATIGAPANFGGGAPAFNTGAAPAFQQAAAPQFNQPTAAAATPGFAPAPQQFAPSSQPAPAFQQAQPQFQQAQPVQQQAAPVFATQQSPAQFQQTAPVMQQQPQFQQPVATAMAPAGSIPTQNLAPAVAEQPQWANNQPQQGHVPQQQQVQQQAAPSQAVPTGAPVPPWLQAAGAPAQ